MKLSKLVLPLRMFEPKVNEMITSLCAYGQKDPIIVKGRTVVDGVVRCLAAQALGWEEIEVQKL